MNNGRSEFVKAMDVEAHRDLRLLEAVHQDSRVTQRGLTVIDVDPSRNVILVSGAVPGPKGSLVEIREDVH